MDGVKWTEEAKPMQTDWWRGEPNMTIQIGQKKKEIQDYLNWEVGGKFADYKKLLTIRLVVNF